MVETSPWRKEGKVFQPASEGDVLNLHHNMERRYG
jgi:hypothetical protein